NVAEIPRAVARGNVHAATERDSEVSEIAADADALAHRIAGATGGARLGIAKTDLRVDEVADRLRAPPAARYRVELRPREIGEIVAVAITARNQEHQHFRRQPGDRRQHGGGGGSVWESV